MVYYYLPFNLFVVFTSILFLASAVQSLKAPLLAAGFFSRRTLLPVMMSSAAYKIPVFQSEVRSCLIEKAKSIDSALAQGSKFGAQT